MEKRTPFLKREVGFFVDRENPMENRIHVYRLTLIPLVVMFIVPALVYARGEKVAIIAPSVSTSMEARSIMRRLGWFESNLREAKAILVVVRSMLFNPMNYSYGSIKEIRDDAERQLNISGANFHIYLYQINDDLSVTQLKHTSYKAED